MNKFWATFGLTYKSKVKSKSFMIFMVIVIILMVALSNADKIIDMFKGDDDHIGVVTNNEPLYKAIKQQSHVIDEEATFERVSQKEAKSQVKSEKLKEAYIIKMDKDHQLSVTILSKDNVSQEKQQKVTGLLTNLQSKLIASKLHLSDNDLKKLQSQSKVDSHILSDDKGQQLSESQKVFNMILVYAILMLMFFIIFNYATQVAMEIATEKTSRVIEMIITSVSPITHIMAKITGVIAVAFTQIAMIIVVAIICIYAFDLKRMLKGFDLSMSDISWQIIIVGILSVIIGILTYVLLAAILGSLASRIEDINQTLMPLTLFAMIAFYIAIFSIYKPDILLAKITSFIPFLAPFEMLVRAQSTELQIWEIVLSMLISLVVMVILLWIAIKTYKDSVLTFEKGLINSIKKVMKK
ncbi:ABC-2 type transport system permease protein [Staphylococcus pasteuri]|uniref:ABC-2 type transport system permease protein n=2 Tax=Staphylococcus TaxID=1279 RepID=A0ABY1H2X3_9STAP|nr:MULTISPECIES: ABC transporter permease [Staphylococcus]ATH61960.1 sodium ABC transporter permease [Staphylococcus pasteuri]KKI56275.1 ABC-type Na+ efflux pump, permease component [Staphylococcus pasteuri]MCF7600142.1 ABC transporter permease [Staphylococcus pasteuri]MDI3231668.1 ABC transporter permease [Staphylococcus pasteuri]MDO6574847.1 ABC transporter permease [Staphylococcus pasteuri_A]